MKPAVENINRTHRWHISKELTEFILFAQEKRLLGSVKQLLKARDQFVWRDINAMKTSEDYYIAERELPDGRKAWVKPKEQKY